MKKFTTWFLVLLLCTNLIPAFSTTVKASNTTWYVSPTGIDINAGDILHPFKTLRKAIDTSNNGDTIYMRGGEYNLITSGSGIIINRSGISRAQPFTIMSYPGETAILNGNGYSFTAYYGILSIGTLTTHCNNVTIQNLRFENSSQNAISAYSTTRTGPCHDIQILNCSFYNIAERAVLMYGEGTSTTNPFTNIKLSNCTFEKIQNIASMGEAVTFEYCKNFDISYNTFTDIRKIFIDVASGSSYGQIHHNNCHITGTESAAIYIDAASYNGQVCSWIRIHNNTIWGMADDGSANHAIAVTAEVAGGITHNITIENNIINRSAFTTSGNHPYGIGVKGSYPLRDITIKHNTVYIYGGQSGAFGSCFYGQAYQAARVIVTNNIFIYKGTSRYCVKIQNCDSTDTNYIFYSNLYYRLDDKTNINWFLDTTNVPEATAIIGDPQCINVNTGNFHLNNTSPAIDTADSRYTVSTDYDCRPRPHNRNYDIGAYEYYSDKTVPLEITNIKITPDLQWNGGYLNISCEITDDEGGANDAWVNIIYPDHTTQNFPMNSKYYLNQTYSQIGTYKFFIWVKDSNGNRYFSEEYMFQIIPILCSNFLVGIISDDTDLSESIINIKAKFVLYISFNPFSINLLSSNEKIIILKDNMGYLGTKFIIGIFNSAVLSQ